MRVARFKFKRPRLLFDSQCLLGSEFSGILIQLSGGKYIQEGPCGGDDKCTHFLRHLALARLLADSDMVEC